MLEKRLDTLARMMEESTQYAALEAALWRQLAAHVDHEHFERTGQIMVSALSIEALSAQALPALGRVAPADVAEALEALVLKQHLVAVVREGRPTAYRLLLAQPENVQQSI